MGKTLMSSSLSVASILTSTGSPSSASWIAFSTAFCMPVWWRLCSFAILIAAGCGVPAAVTDSSTRAASRVSVPVLSTQSTSSWPRVGRQSRCFTITFSLLESVLAPSARQTVTTTGSISGVKPTPTLTAYRNASVDQPLLQVWIISTSGHMMSVNWSIRAPNFSIPLSKALFGLRPLRLSAICPTRVSSPVAITRPTALPLSTWVPMKQISSSVRYSDTPSRTPVLNLVEQRLLEPQQPFFRPVAAWASAAAYARGLAFFSTGIDSPVRID
mmetsp:Transcript_6919/g.12724  ORF Transcript_6919/g.12724 Transcript_6919/m.12724 type:complete len:272 (-) Transcript_6919:736-1551(-)